VVYDICEQKMTTKLARQPTYNNLVGFIAMLDKSEREMRRFNADIPSVKLLMELRDIDGDMYKAMFKKKKII